MKYIWNDYSEENRFILGTESIVAGVEVWGESKNDITVNVLPRLFDLVFPQKIVNTEEKYMDLLEKYTGSEMYKEVFNLLIHFQAFFDLNSGIGLNDAIIMLLENQINEGVFGGRVKDWYDLCTKTAKYFILNSYVEYLKSDNKENYFDSFLETYFKVINFYHQKSSNKDYIYIHVDKTEENLAVYNLAEYFLHDINRDIEIMWKGEHIPIIGFDFSMIIDNMCI